MKLPLLCHGKIAGYREIFNPVPLYIGDKQNEINADFVSLNFTVENITISPEITLEQIGRITSDIKTTVIGYGHIPVMFVKACPMHNVKTCAECNGKGFLTDRKGMKLPLLCHGKIAGFREIFNPVPLYIGDTQNEINADFVSLNFTVENKATVEKIINRFITGQSLGSDFTRGLYYKASL